MAPDGANKIIVVGSGPAGMAVALGLLKAGHQVVIYERYPQARPAGNILNLWPPPVYALQELGVNVEDLGAPCHTTFENPSGHVRADVNLPKHIIDEYHGGFIGLLRPDLYSRMLEALPAGVLQTGRTVSDFEDRGTHVEVTLDDGSTANTPLLIGADGIDSVVRRKLWGATKRPHNLHIIGGFTFDQTVAAKRGVCVLSHSRTVQGTYSSIRNRGRNGHQWWLLEAWPDEKKAPEDLHKHAVGLSAPFSSSLRELVLKTERTNLQRWPIRDLVPIKTWSKGRVTLAGDAAHATSPYAAYGAGMSICDGYVLGQCLSGLDLTSAEAVQTALATYDRRRVEHTKEQVNGAYFLGRLFHHLPFPLTVVRDLVLDWTPFLQRQVGDKNPQEIADQLDEMKRWDAERRTARQSSLVKAY
jgi:2-polyprenyl-6-methoxyphenol hydroxylase-like FAD-dependent oxidoreductase